MIWRAAPFLFSMAVIGALLVAMLSGQRFAFRDVSHFYLPLYDYVAWRCEHQWLPMWNPLDQTGLPLIGESTTAVLYPIRYVVYWCLSDNNLAMNVYLGIHVMLASLTSGWLAQRVGFSPIGIATAALVYPLSGSVFSLCSNPPFLVGAAWLPLALGALLIKDPCPRGGMRARVRWASFALAMMVLGGDPQTAFHCGLIGGVAVVVSWSFFKKTREHGAEAWLTTKVLLLSSGLALGLAAIQVCASVQWSRQSDRVLAAEQLEKYDFSLPPWHLAEVAAAQPFGTLYPVHSRISMMIPGDGRMWTPSCYAGVVVALALMCSFAAWKTSLGDPWWLLCVAGMLASLGHFGAVWVIQQIPGALSSWGSDVGGLYWLLCELVPGYDAFRYPVKWLPVFALGAAMITGRWISFPPQAFEWPVVNALGTLCLVGGVVCLVGAQTTIDTRGIADEYWGPLNTERGFYIAFRSCCVSLSVLFGLAVLRLFDRGVERGTIRLSYP